MTLRKPVVAAMALALVLLCGGLSVMFAVAASDGETTWQPKKGLPLTEPLQVYSRDGVLRVRLDAKQRTVSISGAPITARPFNGRLIGPTLHIRPGDKLDVTIRNAMSDETNIHYHGMHVAPTGISDNVFRAFEPGKTVKSIVRVPKDHSPGTYWYHVHLHGLTEEQVMGGLSGLLIVDGLKSLLPKRLRNVPERQIALRDVQTNGGSVILDAANLNPSEPSTWLVNGLLEPRMSLKSGETQLWHIANIGADLFYNVQLTGHKLYVIGEDGSPVWRVRTADKLVVPPGKRFDVLVRGGKPGTYAFRSLKYDEGFELLPTKTLMDVKVNGPASDSRLPIPATLPTPAKSIAKRPVARRRTFTFSFGTGQQFTALINGEQFNPDETNVAPFVNTVEEWTLRNVTGEDHPFHIHVNDFQVMSVNGKPYHADGLQDVVTIPKQEGKKPGEVVIRNPFDHYTGHFVFHCHILGHEDAGMMQTVQVLKRGQRPTPPPEMGGMGHDMSGMGHDMSGMGHDMVDMADE